jgi:uncharacterized protein (TIGR02611 family)
MRRHAKRIGIFVLGWALIAAGVAMLVLPGPGLLVIIIGLGVLATEFEWAERRQTQLKTAYHAKKDQMLRRHRERVEGRHAHDAVEAAGDVGELPLEPDVTPEPARLRAPHEL